MGRRSSVKAERRALRATRQRAHRWRSGQGRTRGCLFCRRSDGGFRGQEHIVSEALGNKSLLLPNGVVCDRCNNTVLSQLDAELASFAPLALQRVLKGLSGKTGRLPAAQFGNLTVIRQDRQNIVFNSNSPKALELRPDGFTINAIGRKMTPAYVSRLSRALLKIGFELLWLDLGPEKALDPKYDQVREAVLGAKRHGYLLLARSGKPGPSVTMTHWPVQRLDGYDFLAVAADFYGVHMATDSLQPFPAQPLPSDFAVVARY